MDLVEKGSQTAKNGFRNEDDIVKKFNEWEIDKDAQNWLILMQYELSEIEFVEAVKISGYKEIDKGDGMDGHVIHRDKFMLNYLDHRKGKRKYQEINNTNSNDSKPEKITLISKIRVQLKNFIFKLFN